MAIEVETNSVIYSGKDYRALLELMEHVLAQLSALRQAQLDEWVSETEKREADADALLRGKFIYPYYYDYKDYLRDIHIFNERPIAWWRNVLKLSKPVKVDKYGSAESYAVAKYGQTFEAWKAEKALVDIWYIIRRYAGNGRALLSNEWAEQLEEMVEIAKTASLAGEEPQFVIPRADFDRYFEIVKQANSNTIEDVPDLFNKWDFCLEPVTINY